MTDETHIELWRGQDVIRDAETGALAKVTFNSAMEMRLTAEHGWEVRYDDGPWKPWQPPQEKTS